MLGYRPHRQEDRWRRPPEQRGHSVWTYLLEVSVGGELAVNRERCSFVNES